MKITPRDSEILELLREGCDNKEIARRLGIATRTVKQHIRILCLRAGLKGPKEQYHKRVPLLAALDGHELDRAKMLGLSEGKQIVIEAVCAGKSNLEIATHFGIAEQTVKNMLRPIYEDFGVCSRLELYVMFTKAKETQCATD